MECAQGSSRILRHMNVRKLEPTTVRLWDKLVPQSRVQRASAKCIMTLTHSAASSYLANLLGMGIAVESDEEIPA
jgi:hypothetical protein